MSSRVGAVLSILTLVGCVGNSPLMTPGQDCMRAGCHAPSGGGAHPFSIAGTVYAGVSLPDENGVEGADVHVVDATGHTSDLQTNAAGNFYSRDDLNYPLTVSVQLGSSTRHMEPSVSDGGCNRCHGFPPSEGAEGRVYVLPTVAP
jgi:hypothetical protein